MSYVQKLSEQVEDFVSLYARTVRASMSGSLLDPVPDQTEILANESRSYLSPSVFLGVSYILGFTLITCLATKDLGTALSAALDIVQLNHSAILHRFLLGLLFCASFVSILSVWSAARWSYRLLFAVGLLSTWRSMLSAGAILYPVSNRTFQCLIWAAILVATALGSARRKGPTAEQLHAPVTLGTCHERVSSWLVVLSSWPRVFSSRIRSKAPVSQSWRDRFNGRLRDFRISASERWARAKERLRNEPARRVLQMLCAIAAASTYAKVSAPKSYALDLAYGITVTIAALSVLRQMNLRELHRAAYFTGTSLLLISLVVPFIFANLPHPHTNSTPSSDLQMVLFSMLMAVLLAVGSLFSELRVGAGYLGLTLFSIVTTWALAKPLAVGLASQPAPIVSGYLMRSGEGVKMFDCGDGKIKPLLFGNDTSGWHRIAEHISTASSSCSLIRTLPFRTGSARLWLAP